MLIKVRLPADLKSNLVLFFFPQEFLRAFLYFYVEVLCQISEASDHRLVGGATGWVGGATGWVGGATGWVGGATPPPGGQRWNCRSAELSLNEFPSRDVDSDFSLRFPGSVSEQ